MNYHGIVFDKFRNKLSLEFKDLKEIEMHEYLDGFCLINIPLDFYTTTGMNTLDDAVKKVIKKYFKLFLKYIDPDKADKYCLDTTIDEENIWILII